MEQIEIERKLNIVSPCLRTAFFTFVFKKNVNLARKESELNKQQAGEQERKYTYTELLIKQRHKHNRNWPPWP